MAADLDSVVKQLTDSGIIAPGKLASFVPPKASPASLDEFVAALVTSGNLTKFQAAHVKAGRAKVLILGEYTILDKIGAGGMGQVFKAQHRRMKRVVAIKMLPPATTKDAQALARFEREVEAAAKLSHHNIVTAYDAGQSGQHSFLVMEYVEGQDLSSLVKAQGPLPVAKAVGWASCKRPVAWNSLMRMKAWCIAISSPPTCCWTKKARSRFSTWGWPGSKPGAMRPKRKLTNSGMIMGTVDYMAPPPPPPNKA